MENFVSPSSTTGDAAEGHGELQRFFEPVVRHWKLVVVIALLISAATDVYYRQQTPTYTASTSVFLQPSSLESALNPGTPAGDPSRAAENQAHLAVTPAVAQSAATQLDYHGDPRALLALVSAIPDPNSDFLTITATSPDPQEAANVANAFAQGLIQRGTGRLRSEAARVDASITNRLTELAPTPENKLLRRNLLDQLQRAKLIETVPPEGAYQVNRATPPAAAAGPSPLRNAFFAGILGLILGALSVHGLERLQRRLPTSSAEEAYGLPLLTTVPFSGEAASEAHGGPGLPAPMIEPVRTIRTALEHGAGAGPRPRTILVTSAIQGEGKSMLTKCLALGFYQGGRRVLVIDADLRRPSLAGFFDVAPEPGLSDVLRSGRPLAECVTPTILEEETASAVKADAIPFEPDPLAGEPIAASGTGSVSGTRSAPQQSPSKTRSGKRRQGSAKGRSQNGAKRAGSVAEGLPVVNLLPGGSQPPDPGALLGTAGMTQLLSEAAASYDVVLIDSAPVLAVSDAIPLATAVDGVIVVTRSDYTPRDAAGGLRRMLERLPDVNVLGLVANCVPDSECPPQYRYQYADRA